MVKVVMMIGPSGCGKSTAAQSLKDAGYNIVSSDAIRGELFGDESIQENPQKVFYTAFNRVLSSVKNGENVVFDATNLKVKDRRKFFDYMRVAPEHKTIAFVVACSFETAVYQNNQRDRKVPIDVIHRQFSQFEMPQYYEGFDSIVIHKAESSYYSPSERDHFAYRMMNMKHDNIHHKLSVGAHCECVAMAMSDSDDSIEYQVGKWHDVGKLYTKSFTNNKGEHTQYAHYYNHANWSAMYFLLLAYCDEDSTDYEDLVIGAQAISLHMMRYMNFRKPGSWEKWAASVQNGDQRITKMINLLCKLMKADEENP